MNFAAAHFSGDIFRKVSLIHFNDLYPDVVTEIFSKNPMSLIIILPEGNNERHFSSSQQKVWEYIQYQLATEKIAMPVYFAFETQKLQELYGVLKS